MPCPCQSSQGHSTAVETAVLCCGIEKNLVVGVWHGHGMASVNQTRARCVNQMGKTPSKPSAAWHGRGTARARHGNGMLCVNRPLKSHKHDTCPNSRPYIKAMFSGYEKIPSLVKVDGRSTCQNSYPFCASRRFIYHAHEDMPLVIHHEPNELRPYHHALFV